MTSYTATVGGMNCLHRRVREIIAVGVLSGLQSSDWTQGREFEYQFFFPLHSPCVMFLVMNVTFGVELVSNELASEAFVEIV